MANDTNLNIPYTLGLDIGMASVGAALLTEDRILGLHVRCFDKAEVAKTGESLNAQRRMARSTRRRLRRRRYRLLRLARLMKREGLVHTSDPSVFMSAGINPWTLRARGLDNRLEPTEWAAALYHLCKHRGFQSTRKTEVADDKEATAMLEAIQQNRQSLGKYRTPGEMAVRDEAFAEAKRNKAGTYVRTFLRADLEAELALLFERQRALGNPHATESMQSEVHKWLMARRPALSGQALAKLVGKCTLEPSETRAAKHSWRAERFVWLSMLNNLRITCRGKTRPLSDAERLLLRDAPFTLSKFQYAQARKMLELGEDDRFNRLSYGGPDGKDPESTTLYEAKGYHRLRKAFEAADEKDLWTQVRTNPDLLDTLASILTYEKTDVDIRARLAPLDLPGRLIEELLGVNFDKFIQLSTKALSNLLPHLEEGLRYDEAAVAAGYHHSVARPLASRSRYLPAPDRDEIRNPIVFRALNQARKVVNAIVRQYGPPAAVHIELARDLSRPYDERQKVMREQRKFQTDKIKAVDEFAKELGIQPRRDGLQRFQLYREQGGQCAYSGRSLDLHRLMEDGYVEIDHILPFSRSFDDSKANRVLVLTEENRKKGNRTPYEYLGGATESEAWRAFVARVRANKMLRAAKRDRLLRIHFGKEEAGEFKDRNLNDTRYICRAFKDMVERHLEFHPTAKAQERCVVVAGQFTSLLRARWGLVKLRENGDLHHAMDAAVIAACSRAFVKRIADFSKAGELKYARKDGVYVDLETGEHLDPATLLPEERFPMPWPHFRLELLGRLHRFPQTHLEGLPGHSPEVVAGIKPVRVSRAVKRRGTGQAHQETIRSKGRGNQLIAEGRSAIKKPLTGINRKLLKQMVGYDDPRNQQMVAALEARLDAFGDDPAKAFAEPFRKPSKAGRQAPVIRTLNLWEVQKSGLEVRGGIANNGEMLRLDIFRKAGKFYSVPIYVHDRTRGVLPDRASVAFKPESEWVVMDETFEFLFTLHANDWVKVVKKDGEVIEGYYQSFNRATAVISIGVHDRFPNRHPAGTGGDGLVYKDLPPDGLWQSIGIKTAAAVEKFEVDLLGTIHRARTGGIRPPLG